MPSTRRKPSTDAGVAGGAALETYTRSRIDGSEVRLRRERIGLTQQQLAEELGVAENTVARWERGERRISRAHLVRLGLERLEQSDGKATELAIPVARHDLPLSPTRLIGRDQDVASLRELLVRRDVRLVTLTGVGGSGKTRLALAAVPHVANHFEHGVYFVDLAPIRDAELVVSVIARALGLDDAGISPLLERLATWLHDRAVLLLLDNFEHLIDASPVLSRLLESCERLTVLVTSRSLLGLRWEHGVVVPPLALPLENDPLRPGGLAEVPSVALFVERARAAAADFSLDQSNASDVAQLVRHLDGLPLAIELAASRCRVMSPAEIVARLNDRFSLLSNGHQDLPARQRTLRASLDWSYELLAPSEQTLLCAVSVCSGGFTLQAAEALVPTNANVLESLERLVTRSLIYPERRRGTTRYRVLETIREYAAEKLAELPAHKDVVRWHGSYFLALAERLSPDLSGAGQVEALQLLNEEHDNLRVALRWAVAGADGQLALRLAAAVWEFWWIQTYLHEGRQWLEAALGAATDAPPLLRARALCGLGALAIAQADPHAQTYIDESIALFELVGATAEIARVYAMRGGAAMVRGDITEAIGSNEEALRRAGSEDFWSRGLAHFGLGLCARATADLDRAASHFGEALSWNRRTTATHAIGSVLTVVGMVAWEREAHEKGYAAHREALGHLRQIPERWAVMYCLTGLARAAALLQDFRRAVRLESAVEALRARTETGGFWLSPGADILELARQHLSDSELAVESSIGAKLSIEQVIDDALAMPEQLPTRSVAAQALPLQASSLIGRDNDLEAICDLVRRDDVRLVTLTGPGGSGKTRLAIEAARQLERDFAHGVAFIDLSPVSDQALVATAIARPLGVRDTGRQSILESLKFWLSDRQVLLVLDNFEHLLASSGLVSELLSDSPNFKVLVTSRAPLRLRWEHELAVPPLPVPSATDATDLERLAMVASVRLFFERARGVNMPGLSADNASSVVELCTRLDGLPLAIELAAARLKVLDIRTILLHLNTSFDVLGGGARDLPPRQRTLRATMLWSYSLLDAAEQQLLRWLGVFAGGFDFAAVDTLAPATQPRGAHTVELLSTLVEHSLVVVDGTDVTRRHRLLDTVRAFAREQLVDANESAQVERAHAAYFVELAERAAREFEGPGLPEAVALLEREHANLRTAFRWSIDVEHTDFALRLGRALSYFWWIGGYLAEGRQWLEQALRLPGDPHSALRGRALMGLATLAANQADFVRADAAADEAIRLFAELGDEAGRARALGVKAPTQAMQGFLREAGLLLEEALALHRRLDDAWGEGFALHTSAHVALLRGRLAEAQRLIDQSLARNNKLDDPRGLAFIRWEQAIIDAARHRPDRAEIELRAALELFKRIGESFGALPCIATLGRMALLRKSFARAARLCSAAHALQLSLGGLPLLQFGEDLDAVIAAARRALPESEFAAAVAAGRAMRLDQAIDAALAPDVARQPGRPAPDVLTRREREVAALVSHGLTNRAIADQLVIAERTVETHLERVYAKLAIRSRAQLGRWMSEEQRS